MGLLAAPLAMFPPSVLSGGARAQGAGGSEALPGVEAAGWRLTRSQAAGGSAVSIMRTVDPSKSALEIAGLMFRCAGGGTDAIVIMLTPFKPDAKPRVRIDLGGIRLDAEVSVLPTGAGLLMPREMMDVFARPEKATADLRIEIDAGGAPLVAVIGRLYAAPALLRLQEQCSAPR